MGTYITVASVRRTVGIDSTEISNDDVEDTISEVEKQVPRFFNTVFVPTERIDILDGDGTNRLLVDKNPILSVRELKIDGTTVDPIKLEIYKESGYVFLGQSSETPKFSAKRNSNVIKYLYGTVEHSDSILTTSTAASIAGTSIVLAVAAGTTFTVGNWIEIYGMDGFKETAKITAKATLTITVDQLVQTHESGSNITELEISENFTKIMNLVGAIAMIARIIGQSYKDIVGYNLGEMRVQKGEPYTQWREAANQFIRERDEMYKRISIRPRVT